MLAGFRARTLSPVDYMEHVLNRIARFNPGVNAFFFTDPDGARAGRRRNPKRAGRRGAPRGSLDGLPFSVKDHVLTKGMPSPWGTTAVDLKGPWLADAPAVARLKEDGAILIGKTTQPELASLCSGPQQSLRHRAQSLGPVEDARRLVRRARRRRWPPTWARLAFGSDGRRLDPQSGRLYRRRRLQAELRPHSAGAADGPWAHLWADDAPRFRSAAGPERGHAARLAGRLFPAL